MPFQNNSTMRPLMDQVEGGPPAAWKCLLYIHNLCLEPTDRVICGKITSTLSGMISHQKQVHNFEPQLELKQNEK